MPVKNTRPCRQILQKYTHACAQLKLELVARHGEQVAATLAATIAALQNDLRTVSTDYSNLESYEYLKTIRQALKPCFLQRQEYYLKCVEDERTPEDMSHSYARYVYGEAWLLCEGIFQAALAFMRCRTMELKLQNMAESSQQQPPQRLQNFAQENTEGGAAAAAAAGAAATSAQSNTKKGKQKQAKKTAGKQKAKKGAALQVDDDLALEEALAVAAEEKLAFELNALDLQEVVALLQRVDMDIEKTFTYRGGEYRWAAFPGLRIPSPEYMKKVLLSSRLSPGMLQSMMIAMTGRSCPQQRAEFLCELLCFVVDSMSDDAVGVFDSGIQFWTMVASLVEITEEGGMNELDFGNNIDTVKHAPPGILHAIVNAYNVLGACTRCYAQLGIILVSCEDDNTFNDTGIARLCTVFKQQWSAELLSEQGVQDVALRLLQYWYSRYPQVLTAQPCVQGQDFTEETNLLMDALEAAGADAVLQDSAVPEGLKRRFAQQWTHTVLLSWENAEFMPFHCNVNQHVGESGSQSELTLQFAEEDKRLVDTARDVWIPKISTGYFSAKGFYHRQFDWLGNFKVQFV